MSLWLSLGPQHPAAHGVLCLWLYLTAEVITGTNMVIGYLHRGTERLMEYKGYTSCVAYMDRLDYVSVLINEHLWVLSLESVSSVSVDHAARCSRVVLLELTRIINMLLAVPCHVMDIGCMTPMLACFEDRDRLYNLMELLVGVRYHGAFLMVGSCISMTSSLWSMVTGLLYAVLVNLDTLLLWVVGSHVTFLRLRHLSAISTHHAASLACSGVLLRSTGLPYDLRYLIGYETYRLVHWEVLCGSSGDLYDRTLLRLVDVLVSVGLIVSLGHLTPATSRALVQNIDSVIVTYLSLWVYLTSCLAFASCESPKGEYLVLCVISGVGSNVRCRVRTPDFFHLAMMVTLGLGLSDVVSIIGSLDVVFGSVSR